jgi:hypothetical protein
MLRKSEFQFRHNRCNESFATAIRQPRNSRCSLMNFALLTYMSTWCRRGSETPLVDMHVDNWPSGDRRHDLENRHSAGSVDSQSDSPGVIRGVDGRSPRAFAGKQIP